MAVDFNDERLVNVENEKNNAVNEVTNTYNSMINNSDKYYQAQIDATKNYEKTQTDLQNQQTNLITEKINQEKDQAKKDYIKEQKGAYTDYQKATNQYGANAEKMAVQGLNTAGYSESTRTSAYNTYQNRYATAKQSYDNAILNYNNSIKEAQLANSSAMAQIAYNSLQQQLELSLQGFQYKNSLIETKLNAINSEKDRYYSRWQNVLNQINTENALAEQQRQFNEEMAEKQRQYNETMAYNKAQAEQAQSNWEKEYALSLASSRSSGKSSGGSSSSSKSSSNNNNIKKLTDLSDYAQKLIKTYNDTSAFLSKKPKRLEEQKQKWRDEIYNSVVSGKLNDTEADVIFNKFSL